MKKEIFNIYNNKLSTDKRLAVISDMHLTNKIDSNYFNSMMSTINDINPDYITLVGDYFGVTPKYSFQNPTTKKHLIYYLHALRDIAPVVMSLGNHDIQRVHDKEKRQLFRDLKDTNIYPLDNENIILGDFNFMGYMIPKWAYPVDKITKRKERMIVKDIKDVNFQIEENKMNILLSHLPNLIEDEYIQKMASELFQYDLVLSGHFHNGILSDEEVEKLNNLIDRLEQISFLKNKKEYLESLRYAGWCLVTLNKIPIISKTTRGIHNINGTTMIISKGAHKNRGIDNSYITQVNCLKLK